MNKRTKDSTCAKNKYRQIQLEKFYDFLKEHVATCSMASEAISVKQKCLTWYKRDLEKAGLLWEVKHDRCPITGFKAWFITCNPKLKPEDNQLKLFGNE